MIYNNYRNGKKKTIINYYYSYYTPDGSAVAIIRVTVWCSTRFRRSRDEREGAMASRRIVVVSAVHRRRQPL